MALFQGLLWSDSIKTTSAGHLKVSCPLQSHHPLEPSPTQSDCQGLGIAEGTEVAQEDLPMDS